MENRRRMGKRQMGEINLSQSQSHPAAPLWGLESLADLTQWKWMPPSPPDVRLQRVRAKTSPAPDLAQGMMNWLAKVTPDLPADEGSRQRLDAVGIGSPRDVIQDEEVDEEVVEEVAEAEASLTYTPGSTGQPSPKPIWDAQSSPSEIIDTGLNMICQDLTNTETEVMPNLENFCNSWKDCLAGGLFSGEAIISVLDGVQCGLDMAYAEDPLEWVKSKLFEATIAGLSYGRIDEHGGFDRLAWSGVLHRISELRINNIRVFKLAMARIPDCHLNAMSTGILANLRAYLIASGYEGRRSALIRQVNKITVPLRRLGLVNHFNILESGTKYVLTYKDSKELDYSRMRLGWLQLLARLPDVDENYLVTACRILEAGREVEPLSNREICEMYLAKHRSSIKGITIMHNALQENKVDNDSKCYGFLTLDLWRTGQFAHVRGLCGFLSDLGREQGVMRLAKAFRNLVKNPAAPLANLAIGAGLPTLAMDIFALYERSRSDPVHFWQSDFSTKALKLLTSTRSLRHDTILDTLRVHTSKSARDLLARQGRIVFHRKREILKLVKAATAFAHSPNITNRKSLNLISECIRYLQRSRGGVIPAAALQALLHNITRDLAEGKVGRTTRLRWFLHLLHKQVGHDKMIRTGLVIKRWRMANARLLYGC
ncbi:hypothetical protein AAE478_000976 [Parahypoxylon ruwenzoriense]